ncbi:hypothetical protein VTO42DRAFT_3566 [Malbranchea cinnamomea]
MPAISKTRRLPFKPPSRISTTGESSSTAPPLSRKRTVPAVTNSRGKGPKRRDVRTSPSPEPEPSSESGSPSASASGSASSDGQEPTEPFSEPDFVLAEITTAKNNDDDIMTAEPKIPSKLVTALLYHHFQDGKTKITKDAAKLYAKYIEIFVREAVARAVYERKEKLESETIGSSRIQTMRDSLLEVEDLEKLVPQLLLDF